MRDGFRPAGIEVRHDDGAVMRTRQDERGQTSDRPAAHHQDRFARAGAKSPDGVKRDGERFGKDCDARLKRRVMSDQKSGGQLYLLSKSAVADLADKPERLANIGHSRAARRHRPHQKREVGHHQITGREASDIGANRRDTAAELMTRGGGSPRNPLSGSIVVNVRSAYAGRPHFNVGETRRRWRWPINLIDPQVEPAMEAYGFHAQLFPPR